MRDDMITVQQAAKMGNISEGYIRRMLIQGGFNDLVADKDYKKLGKVWIINKNKWIKHLVNCGRLNEEVVRA